MTNEASKIKKIYRLQLIRKAGKKRKAINLTNEIRENKLKWFVHIIRIDHSKICIDINAKVVVIMNLKPMSRWSDEIERNIKITIV